MEGGFTSGADMEPACQPVDRSDTQTHDGQVVDNLTYNIWLNSNVDSDSDSEDGAGDEAGDPEKVKRRAQRSQRLRVGRTARAMFLDWDAPEEADLEPFDIIIGAGEPR